MRLRPAALLLVLAALAWPAAAGACPKTSVGDVEDEVMCQVCGTSLALATEAPQAQRERELVRRLVERCKSKDEVKAVLVAEFGKGVLAAPGGDGFDLAAYLVPTLAILLAGGAVGAAALGWRRNRAAGGGPPASGTGPGGASPAARAAERRLDQDLERYDL